MAAPLKVAAVALDIAPSDRTANLALAEQAINALPSDVDVVVLPELFTTGFSLDEDFPASVAESITGPTIDAVARIARQRNMAIAGSFAARVAHQHFNRAFFIEPSGEETYYDKRHLFSRGGEHNVFHAGTERFRTVRYRGWNISMIVCYDLRFPVWSRNVDNEYDLLLVPANWPESRQYAWRQLLIARAIENQACVVGANRCGQCGRDVYDHQSYIFNHLGQPAEVAALAPMPGVEILIATLSHDDVEQYRRAFPAAADADSFTID